MISYGSRTETAVWRKVSGVELLEFIVLTVTCEGGKMPLEDVYRLTDMAESLRLYVDSVGGAKVFQFLDMALQFIAEGAAGGLNVIAVYMTEILHATGVPVSVPHFTPEALAFTVKWMLLGGISYWLLCAVMRLMASFVQRIFWMVKIIVVMWIFSWIISDPKASSGAMIVRLFLLVMFAAVWSVTTGGKSRTDLTSLESRLTSLESKVAVMEMSKTECRDKIKKRV